MKRLLRCSLLTGLWIAATALLAAADSPDLPVRGIHLATPKSADVPLLVKFITEALPAEGANLLVLEINYHYRFTKRPEVAEPDSLSKEEVKQIVNAGRQAGVKIIPQINLLGHQSWAKATFSLLRAHPEFDETPGKYPENQGIYCRSYCPLHPQVHDVVFDLMDEIAEVFEADALHAGMDEVFVIGEKECPRCRGRLKSDLFAGEVRTLRDHLALSNRKLWIWGDRLLDGATTGTGEWEGSLNQTFPAIQQIPRDVVICDWHYERAVPTAVHFALMGFPVVSSPWRKPEVGLAQVEMMRMVRATSPQKVGERMQGILQTTWGNSAAFIRAYFGETASANTTEAVKCFREVFAGMRKAPVPRSAPPTGK